MIKIIIFGAGQFYQIKKREICSNVQIVAFVDNNPALQGQYMDGAPIISPNYIYQYSFDKILLMSRRDYADDMKDQLIELGIEEEKIYYWEHFHDELNTGVFKLYCGNSQLVKGRKRILIISTSLNYDGGSIVIVYAARILQSRGYNVILAAPDGSQKFIDEIVRQKINVIIAPSLNHLHREEFFLIQQFDVILVNVFQMIHCACEISKIKPVLWWIHEPIELFDSIVNHYKEYAQLDKMSRIHICAVSKISLKNFNHYFPKRIKEILSFGIPDEKESSEISDNRNKIIFSIIGVVTPRKAQDIFVRAISLLNNESKRNAEFWIIGAIWEDEYVDRVKDFVAKDSSIKILGELTRSEIRKKYSEIDVVVCPSLEEPMSITIMEGMMYEKVCVVSDVVGMAAYIEDGINGFVCRTGDYYNLSRKIKWIIDHKDRLYEIKKQARKTYEKYFTIEKFGDRLENAVQNTIHQYFAEGK